MDPSTRQAAILVGFCLLAVCAFGGYQLATQPATPTSAGGDDRLHLGKIETISHGEEVELARYLEAGTRTVVEFTADW